LKVVGELAKMGADNLADCGGGEFISCDLEQLIAYDYDE